jgi:hypothetical protein
LVDVGIALGNRFGIGPTSGVIALPALGLRKKGINLIDQRIAHYLKADRGNPKNQTEEGENGTQR